MWRKSSKILDLKTHARDIWKIHRGENRVFTFSRLLFFSPNIYFHNQQLFSFLDWKFEIHSTKIRLLIQGRREPCLLRGCNSSNILFCWYYPPTPPSSCCISDYVHWNNLIFEKVWIWSSPGFLMTRKLSTKMAENAFLGLSKFENVLGAHTLPF